MMLTAGVNLLIVALDARRRFGGNHRSTAFWAVGDPVAWRRTNNGKDELQREVGLELRTTAGCGAKQGGPSCQQALAVAARGRKTRRGGVSSKGASAAVQVWKQAPLMAALQGLSSVTV